MLQSTGDSSSNSSISRSYSQIASILEKAERSHDYEKTKLTEYKILIKLLEQEVIQLTKEFIVSDAKFIESKELLLNSKQNFCGLTPETQGLLLLMKYPIENEPTSINLIIKKFHYRSLSDDTIEKLLPIWKNKKYCFSNTQEEMIHFISASIESKMKSDLLSSAKNKLHLALNAMESQKIHLFCVEEKISNLKNKISTFANNDFELSGYFQNDWDNNFVRNNNLLKSDDLYGLDFERGDTSTIIYQNPEPNCPNCVCSPF